MPDLELACRDCGAAFVFTEAEQAYFHGQGFRNPPKRCKACRAKARQRGSGRGASARGESGSGARPGRFHASSNGTPTHAVPVEMAPVGAGHAESQDPSQIPAAAPAGAYGPDAREPRRPRGPMHTTTCSVCTAPTDVPFVPDGVRPVYCLPCLKKQTR